MGFWCSMNPEMPVESTPYISARTQKLRSFRAGPDVMPPSTGLPIATTSASLSPSGLRPLSEGFDRINIAHGMPMSSIPRPRMKADSRHP